MKEKQKKKRINMVATSVSVTSNKSSINLQSNKLTQ